MLQFSGDSNALGLAAVSKVMRSVNLRPNKITTTTTIIINNALITLTLNIKNVAGALHKVTWCVDKLGAKSAVSDNQIEID